MKLVASAISGTKVIESNGIQELMYETTVKLCNCMTDLFMLDLSSSPYYIDQFELRATFLEEFKKDLWLFTDMMSGRIVLDIERLQYAEYLAPDNKKALCKAYREYLGYVDILRKCNKLMESVKCVGNKYKVNLRASASERVLLKSKVDLCCEMLSTGSTIHRICLGKQMLEVLANDIGVSYDNSDGFFVKGLSAEEECSVADLIVDGAVRLDGKYGDKLSDRITSYYTDFYENNNKKVTLLDYNRIMFAKATDLRREFLDSIREDKNFIFMDSNNVYYTTEEDTTYNNKYVGAHLLLNGVESKKVEMVCGLQGSFSTEKPSGVLDDEQMPCFVNGLGYCYLAPMNFNVYGESYKVEQFELARLGRYDEIKNVSELYENAEDIVSNL